MENSKIEWTNHTFNPWWGCNKVSPGCAHCYAETFSRRTGNAIWGKDSPRRFFGDKHWEEPLKWNSSAKASRQRHRVFCASMADVFEDREDLIPHRERVFDLIQKTEWLDWLLLTKRPENIRRLGPARPPKNVWLGTTAEEQRQWDIRVSILLEIEASIHFVSAEPLLGPITTNGLKPDWVIVGGESGPKARPMESSWVGSLRDQCVHEGISYFFKQWGGVRKAKTGRELGGRTWDEVPKIEEI